MRVKRWAHAQTRKSTRDGEYLAGLSLRSPGVVLLLICTLTILLITYPAYADGSWREQPSNWASFISTADKNRVIYDFTFAKMACEYLADLDVDNMTFIFTQCHSGGMLDELRTCLDTAGNVALMSSCAYDETSTIWNRQLNPNGFSESMSYYVDLIVEGFMLSGEYALTMEELAERTDKRNPCEEEYQWIFLGDAAKVRLGQTAEGKEIPPNQLFAVLFVGKEVDDPSGWAWAETEDVYKMLKSVGFPAEHITVLASTSTGTAVEPEPDGPGTWNALQDAIKAVSESEGIEPGGCFFFWTTGHGDQVRIRREP